MLQLFVTNPDRSDAVVRLRWCITPGVLQHLKAKKAVNQHLLVSVVFREHEVQRLVVPLDRAMEFINFGRAGSHRIYAMIIWPNADDISGRSMRRCYLYRESRDYYRFSLIDGEGLFRGDRIEHGHLDYVADLTVDVDERFFAPEPPQWVKRWASFWYETPPRDQCVLRRRCMIAFTIQPWLVLLWAILKIAFRITKAVFYILIGTRGVEFKPIIHPFSWEARDIFAPVNRHRYTPRDNVFFTDKDGVDRSAFFLLLHPAFITVLAIVAFFINRNSAWLEAGKFVVVIVTAMLGFATVIGVVNFMGKFFKKQAVIQEQEEEKATTALIEQTQTVAYDEALADVICHGQPLLAEVEDLPPSRRTWRLQFLDFKARVCRPYGR